MMTARLPKERIRNSGPRTRNGGKTWLLEIFTGPRSPLEKKTGPSEKLALFLIALVIWVLYSTSPFTMCGAPTKSGISELRVSLPSIAFARRRKLGTPELCFDKAIGTLISSTVFDVHV